MRKAPPIVMHIPDDWPSAALAERISEFHFDCIKRRIENMNLNAEQKIKIIDGIIQMFQHVEQSNTE